jgi:hypothetical protein
MVQIIGKAKLRDAAIGTGIAVDKMLALTGQTPPRLASSSCLLKPNARNAGPLTARLDGIARRLMRPREA